MQQGAREQALEVEIEDETARDEAAQASRERQPADIVESEGAQHSDSRHGDAQGPCPAGRERPDFE